MLIVKPSQAILCIAYTHELVEYLPFFKSVLSFDEIDRFNGYLFEKDKIRFLCCRGLLRFLLSLFIDIAPKDIQFERGMYGKPSLIAEQNQLNLQFNVSDSHACLFYGFCLDYPIGIDVEYKRARVEYLELATRFFSREENAYLASLREEDIPSAFYQIWTGKEAFIKAIGRGLSFPLEKFSVIPQKNLTDYFLNIEHHEYHASDWKVKEILHREHYTYSATFSRKISQYELHSLCLTSTSDNGLKLVPNFTYPIIL